MYVQMWTSVKAILAMPTLIAQTTTGHLSASARLVSLEMDSVAKTMTSARLIPTLATPTRHAQIQPARIHALVTKAIWATDRHAQTETNATLPASATQMHTAQIQLEAIRAFARMDSWATARNARTLTSAPPSGRTTEVCLVNSA